MNQLLNPPHSWYGQTSAGARIFYDNPDTIYRLIPVNDASTYEIHGQFLGEQRPADTSFSVISGFSGVTVAYLSGQDLNVNDDGSFVITVDSTDQPANPNHIKIPDNAVGIVTRNTLSDWDKQQAMSLSVVRMTGPPDNVLMQLGVDKIPVVGPLLQGIGDTLATYGIGRATGPLPVEVQALETAVLMLIVGITQQADYIGYATNDRMTGKIKEPNELSAPGHVGGFLATQLQSSGYFQLTDEEALVITIDPGGSGYFVVPVTNDWTITDNYWDQQTSLNNVQARPNTDGSGTYTIVVSPTDPQVANWVSTGGLHQGTIFIRFQDVDPDDPPTVHATKVRLDELDDDGVLPNYQDQKITSADRKAQIEARQEGYDKRFAPYRQSIPLTV